MIPEKFAEQEERLLRELGRVRRNRAMSKRQRERRPLRRKEGDAFFIAMRERIARRHKAKGFEGEIVTSAELITLNEIQEGRCHWTGLEYSFEGGTSNPLYCTIDRRDNARGYSLDNVSLVCWFVNCAKGAWPIEKMISLWRFLPARPD